MGRVTVRQLAEHLGMSKSAVQRALSGKKDVKASKRDAVLKAADELGYVRDSFFSTLASQRQRSRSTNLPVAYFHQTETFGGNISTLGYNLSGELTRIAGSLGFEIEQVSISKETQMDALFF